MEALQVGLLGAGNLGGALIRGLLGSELVQRDQIRASDIRPERLRELEQEYGITTHADNEELVRWASLLILAVKPQSLGSVLDAVGGVVSPETAILSVAAGVPCAFIESRLPAGARVVRAMPNTPALALRGATALTAGSHATEEDMRWAKALFDAVGRTVVVSESLMNAVTGLSGSGPAYVMLIIEAMADGGVQAGLPRDTALLLAAQTVWGAAELLVQTGQHPAVLKDMVASPGGTTIHGLAELEAAGVRHAMMDAVVRATKRAAELGAAMTGAGTRKR